MERRVARAAIAAVLVMILVIGTAPLERVKRLEGTFRDVRTGNDGQLHAS
jgi:hypothetical protein